MIKIVFYLTVLWLLTLGKIIFTDKKDKDEISLSEKKEAVASMVIGWGTEFNTLRNWW